MALNDDCDNLRTVINDCAGYRILADDDVIQAGDESVCGSMLLSLDFSEEWWVIEASDDDGRSFIGRTVRDMNDPAINDEMDATERLFRRKF